MKAPMVTAPLAPNPAPPRKPKPDAPGDTEKRRAQILKALAAEPMSKSQLRHKLKWDVSVVLDAMRDDESVVGAGGKGAGKRWKPA